MPKLPPQLERLKHETNPTLLGIYQTIYSNMDKSSFTADDPDFVVFPTTIVSKMKAARTTVESLFFDGIDDAFKKVLQKPEKKAQSKKLTSAKKTFDIDSLSLMEHDEVELGLISRRIANDLLEVHSSNLAQLAMRFEKLVNHDVEMSQCPLGPAVLCDIIKKSVDAVDMSSENKGFVLKAFMGEFEDKYAELLELANQSLIKQGIMPNLDDDEAKARYNKNKLKEEYKEKRQDLLNEISGKPTGDGESPDMDTIFASIAKMLEETADPAMAQHILKPNTAAQPLSTEKLVETVNQFPAFPELPENEVTYLEPEEHVSIAEKVKASADLEENGLDQKASSTISMISMMFDNILQDPALAPEMKALMQYLEKPILKAALQDPEFLTDSDNPAQQLLNEVASTGMSWSPANNPRRDNVYKKVTSLVKDVSEGFDDDYQVFNEALFDLEDFNEQEKRRTAIIEERMIVTEKARARTEAAKKIASEHVHERFGEFIQPAPVADFLENTWKQVLFFIHNRDESTDSDAWQQAMAIEHQLHDIFSGANSTGALEIEEPMLAQLAEVGIEGKDAEARLTAVLPSFKPLESNPDFTPKPKPVTASPPPTHSPAAPQHSATQAPAPSQATTQQPTRPASETNNDPLDEEPLLGNMSLDDLLGSGDDSESSSDSIEDIDQFPGELDLSSTSTDSSTEFSSEFLDEFGSDASPGEPDEEDDDDFLISDDGVTPASATDNKIEPAATSPGTETTGASSLLEAEEPATPVETASEIAPEFAAPTEADSTETQAEETVPEAPALDEHDEMVEQIGIGTWLQLYTEDSMAKIRIAAHIKHTDTFIMVNRNGTKAGNYTKAELAAALRNGEIQVLEDTLVFDRALQSVISSLRR